MKIEIHHHHYHPEIQPVLKALEKVMAALDDLTAEVARNVTVESSAVTLIQGIAQQLKDALASNDMAALQKLTSDLSSSADALAAAVAANQQPQNPAPPSQ